jgi:hypothetical protein
MNRQVEQQIIITVLVEQTVIVTKSLIFTRDMQTKKSVPHALLLYCSFSLLLSKNAPIKNLSQRQNFQTKHTKKGGYISPNSGSSAKESPRFFLCTCLLLRDGKWEDAKTSEHCPGQSLLASSLSHSSVGNHASVSPTRQMWTEKGGEGAIQRHGKERNQQNERGGITT